MTFERLATLRCDVERSDRVVTLSRAYVTGLHTHEFCDACGL